MGSKATQLTQPSLLVTSLRSALRQCSGVTTRKAYVHDSVYASKRALLLAILFWILGLSQANGPLGVRAGLARPCWHRLATRTSIVLLVLNNKRAQLLAGTIKKHQDTRQC